MPPTPLRRAGFRRLPHALTALLLATIALLVPALPAAAAEADTVYSLLNDARAANGQSALVRNSSLDQVAADWAAQLSASGALSHNPNYPTQIPAGWSEAGENVARGQWTASEMHTDWMNSPGHRANILGNFTDVGVAWLTDASGMTWGVQVFANYPAPIVAVAPAEITAELETLAVPESAEDVAEAADPAVTDPTAAAAPVVSFEGVSVGLAAGILLAAILAVVIILRRRALSAAP